MSHPIAAIPRTPPGGGFYCSLTQHQSTALVDLCQRLAEARDVRIGDLTVWNVALGAATAGDAPDKAQAVVLLKFLRACAFDVQRALDLLLACVKWRRDNCVDLIVDEAAHKEFADCGHLHGRDRQGNAVVYLRYDGLHLSSIFGSETSTGRYTRWCVQLMERAMQSVDLRGLAEGVTMVHDFEGMLFVNLESGGVKTALQRLTKLFHDYYPECVSHQLLLSVPETLERALRDAAEKQDPTLWSRTTVVAEGSGTSRAAMLELISPMELPDSYGGFQRWPLNPASSHGDDTRSTTLAPGDRYEVVLDVPPSTPSSPTRPSTISWCLITGSGTISVTSVFTPTGQTYTASSVAKKQEGQQRPSEPRRHTHEASSSVRDQDTKEGSAPGSSRGSSRPSSGRPSSSRPSSATTIGSAHAGDNAAALVVGSGGSSSSRRASLSSGQLDVPRRHHLATAAPCPASPSATQALLRPSSAKGGTATAAAARRCASFTGLLPVAAGSTVSHSGGSGSAARLSASSGVDSLIGGGPVTTTTVHRQSKLDSCCVVPRRPHLAVAPPPANAAGTLSRSSSSGLSKTSTAAATATAGLTSHSRPGSGRKTTLDEVVERMGVRSQSWSDCNSHAAACSGPGYDGRRGRQADNSGWVRRDASGTAQQQHGSGGGGHQRSLCHKPHCTECASAPSVQLRRATSDVVASSDLRRSTSQVAAQSSHGSVGSSNRGDGGSSSTSDVGPLGGGHGAEGTGDVHEGVMWQGAGERQVSAGGTFRLVLDNPVQRCGSVTVWWSVRVAAGAGAKSMPSATPK